MSRVSSIWICSVFQIDIMIHCCRKKGYLDLIFNEELKSNEVDIVSKAIILDLYYTSRTVFTRITVETLS